MRRCMGCMEMVDDQADVCPHCGYVKGTGVREAYYLEPGTMLQDRYLLGRVLGYGGFGVTYIGYDTSLQRKIAVKEYLPSDFATRKLGTKKVIIYSGDAYEQFMAGLNSFLEEARKLAGFADVSEIVDIYDCFRENDTGYIVMEYLKGNTVKELLKKRKKLPYDEAEEIICHVLDGLAAVHKKGIIHRDVAPDNIFITDEGEVKLLDFGAARYAASIYSRSLSVILKPGYAPEEQYRSHGKQGPWTDVYGVGATFYRMITGVRLPESLERMIEDDLEKPSKLGAGIPEKKEEVLMKSLEVRMEDRIQSADEFREALSEKNPDRKKDKREDEQKRKERKERKPKSEGDINPPGRKEPEKADRGTPAGGKLFVKLGIICCVAGIFFAGFYFGKGMIGGESGGESGVKIDAAHFPDETFRAYVDSSFDKNGDGVLSTEEIEEVVQIEVNSSDGSGKIESLKGIEYFISLEELDCSYNQLGELDVSQNLKLKELDCGGNLLSKLDVSQNPALRELNCIRNQLSSLDVSQNSALEVLYCRDNQLRSLDVGWNPELKILYCHSNQLRSLDVSQNPALEILGCSSNQLSSLDVSQNPALIRLNCDSNQLNSLDVSRNSALEVLYCKNNQLNSLDISQNLALETLNCRDNQLSSLDVSQNPELETLNCRSNQLSSLDISQNPKLENLGYSGNPLREEDIFGLGKTKENITEQEEDSSGVRIDETHFPDETFRAYVGNSFDKNGDGSLSEKEIEEIVQIDVHFSDGRSKIESLEGIKYFTSLAELNCKDNQLSNLDMSQNPELEMLNCSGNRLSSLDVNQNQKLKELDCSDNQLSALDVSQNPGLGVLDCGYNQLGELDVSQNPVLESLDCYNNQLSELDVSQNPGLGVLDCGYNQLGKLDVSQNPALETLGCFGNLLSELDVSQNPGLESLDCEFNQLNSLDVSQNPALKTLSCGDNQLRNLDISQNPALVQLQCTRNQLSSLDVSQNPALETLYCGNNRLSELDVSQNPVLVQLHCSRNQLSSLDVSQNPALEELLCFNNQLGDLDVSHNPVLTEIYK